MELSWKIRIWVYEENYLNIVIFFRIFKINIITKCLKLSCFTPKPYGSNSKTLWIQLQELKDLLTRPSRSRRKLARERKIDFCSLFSGYYYDSTYLHSSKLFWRWFEDFLYVMAVLSSFLSNLPCVSWKRFPQLHVYCWIDR